MEDFVGLLNSIKDCDDICGLMQENNEKNIPFVEIEPKPFARVIFIGRDPNPNSIKKVGKIDKRSSFNRGVLKIINGVNEDKVYITNIIKCHWRVTSSKSNPYPQIKDRKAHIPEGKCNKCISKWLIKEIEFLQPKIIVTFGEEAYQHLKRFVVKPNSFIIPKLSATADKSVLDAEKWQYDNGPLEIKVSNSSLIYFAIRHPGNYGLRKDDIRSKINNTNILKINQLLKELD